MARTQAKIHNTIWTDPEWTGLSVAAQHLYLLLLSQPRLNLAGCLDVMPARWARLCAGWTEQDVDQALAELVAEQYVVVDNDELVIRTFVAHDLAAGTVNGNLVKGMWSAWAGIMSPLLRKVVVDNMPTEVWERDGVDRPSAATELRSEPRLELPLEPWFEPRSEPTEELKTEDLKPEACVLNTLIGSQDNTSSEPVDSANPAADDGARLEGEALEQAVRRTAHLVGRAVAAGQAGVGNVTGYAAKITAEILTGPVDIDRGRIRQMLIEGQTPDSIAQGWRADPFGLGTQSGRTGDPEAVERAREAAELRLAETEAKRAEILAVPRDNEAGLARIDDIRNRRTAS